MSHQVAFVNCPVCGNDRIVEMEADWQSQVESGKAIPIVGCGNPWHYRNLDQQAAVAARKVLAAADAYRDAFNGLGHPGEPHDRVLWQSTGGEVEIYDTVGDCAACGGAQYGTEYELQRAYGDLREALGEKRLPWEGP